MGGHFIAMKDGDINLAAQNPSLLDSASCNKLGMNFIDYFSGTHLGSASFAYQLKPKVTLGANLRYMSYGKTDETDITGNVVGQFSAGDYQFTAGAGYSIDSLFNAGANLRLVYSVIAGYSSFAVATDYAATYCHPGKNFTASALIRNIGFSFHGYTDEKQKLPFDIQLGITKRLAHAPFRFSLVATNLNKWDLTNVGENNAVIDPISGQESGQQKFEFGDKLMRHLALGAEFIITPNIFLRIGYNYRRRQELKVSEKPGTAGFSYGFEFKVNRFQVGYGRAIYHLAGPANHFTVTTNIGHR